MTALYEFNEECIKGIITSRPSKIIKSPYVADILINDNDYLAHSPALGLGPHIKKDSVVLLQKSNEKSKTDYSIKGVYDDNIWIGACPLDANRLFKWAYNLNLLNDIPIGNLKAEVKYGDSRFDFCISNEYYVEVKCVPLKNKDNESYFPDGYRKNKNTTVSERANKHIYELIQLKDKGYLIFIVFREDTNCFKPNYDDKQFYNLFIQAKTTGVNIKIYNFKLTSLGYQWLGELNLK